MLINDLAVLRERLNYNKQAFTNSGLPSPAESAIELNNQRIEMTVRQWLFDRKREFDVLIVPALPLGFTDTFEYNPDAEIVINNLEFRLEQWANESREVHLVAVRRGAVSPYMVGPRIR